MLYPEKLLVMRPSELPDGARKVIKHRIADRSLHPAVVTSSATSTPLLRRACATPLHIHNFAGLSKQKL